MNFAAACYNMVENQIRTNKVTDERVLDALRQVPREAFVPKKFQEIAYFDGSLALGSGHHIMPPMVFARLLQSAGIKSTDVVLDVGCATGYSAAVIARLSATVIALEFDAEFCARADSLLSGLSIDNVVVTNGELYSGLPEKKPYDVIVLEGAVEKVPDGLCQQLSDGGRLVAITSEKYGVRPGNAVIIKRIGNIFSHQVIFEAAIPQLPGFAPPSRFEFK